MGAMSSSTFDPAAYQRAPVLSVATAIALVDGLSIARLRSAPPLARKTLTKLQDARARLVEAVRARNNAPVPTRSPQEVDGTADRAWRAVRSYLAGYLDLEPKFAPEQSLAADLDALFFGDGGLAFTALQWVNQRKAMHDRLDALEARGLSEAFVRIVGEPCAQNLRAAVKDYDAMVLAELQSVSDDDASLTPLVREVQRLAVDYARYIVATVDDEDPETAVAARRALAPIDNIRELSARSAPAPEREPVPTPPVDPPKPA